jgi:hypothetical protein
VVRRVVFESFLILGPDVRRQQLDIPKFALDFETLCGIDCDRCWPIKYSRVDPACKTEGWTRQSVEQAGEFFLAQ